jgi:hypothetical protein
MRKVMALARVGAMLAVLAAPAQAEVVDNETIDVDLMQFVPCANGGASDLHFHEWQQS